MLKIKFHSIVDVITNSSTVIYTYQNSITETKELVQEILNLSDNKDLTPDDVFYYGVFCDTGTYSEAIGKMEENGYDENIVNTLGENFADEDYKEQNKKINNLILKILKGEVKKPDWMVLVENGDSDWYSTDTILHLIPKDSKFNNLAGKIEKLLGSVSADGGYKG